MGLNSFILNCEKENEELKKDIEYYKNKSQRLEQQLKQRDDVINETTTIINQYKDFCKRNIEEESYDSVARQNNIYWNDCISKLDYILSILNKRGGTDE